MRDDGPIVRDITAAVYAIPTDAPEADALAWDKTTIVLAAAHQVEVGQHARQFADRPLGAHAHCHRLLRNIVGRRG